MDLQVQDTGRTNPAPNPSPDGMGQLTAVCEPDAIQQGDAVSGPGAAEAPPLVAGPVHPIPPSLSAQDEILRDENKPPDELHVGPCRVLTKSRTVYRASGYAGRATQGARDPNDPPLPVTGAGQLAPGVLDRLRVRHIRGGKAQGHLILVPRGPLLLRAELLRRQFCPLGAPADPTANKPYQSLINRGVVGNRAGLGRYLGISQDRVTQVLRRLKQTENEQPEEEY